MLLRKAPGHAVHLYVPDTDSVYEQELRAGATSIQAPADQPYGDRSAGVTDPFAKRWFIATHIRDVHVTYAATGEMFDSHD